MKISNIIDRAKIKLAQLRAVISDASQTESASSNASDIVALEERIMLSASPLPVDAVVVEAENEAENGGRQNDNESQHDSGG